MHMQVFVDAAAAQQARFDSSPVQLMQTARQGVKDVLSQVADAGQEPSLAAARAASCALAAAHRALAAEGLLAALTLSLAQASTQVGCSS